MHTNSFSVRPPNENGRFDDANGSKPDQTGPVSLVPRLLKYTSRGCPRDACAVVCVCTRKSTIQLLLLHSNSCQGKFLFMCSNQLIRSSTNFFCGPFKGRSPMPRLGNSQEILFLRSYPKNQTWWIVWGANPPINRTMGLPVVWRVFMPFVFALSSSFACLASSPFIAHEEGSKVWNGLYPKKKKFEMVQLWGWFNTCLSILHFHPHLSHMRAHKFKGILWGK